ncbi:MAG: spondin domain-containing protein, partial [Ardenticatenaceae bacterium]
RSLPLANGIASISVSEASGTFSITLENVSATSGAIDTPIAPVFWAVHDSSWQLFTSGQPDDGNGLETLAEDGSPADLVTAHTGAAGTSAVGAAGNAPIGSGEQFQFSVTPDAAHPYVTIAAMVVQTNDAFLAFGAEGVALLDSNGTLRSATDVSADMAKMLAVWDAGTEANEVPGVGANQAPRQAAGNTGPADSDTLVRLYADSTNDLAGGNLGGFTNLTITHSGGTTFDVTLTNASDSTVYPGALTPMLWAVHDNSVKLFQTGTPASAGLQSLAEDGDASTLQAALAAMAGVSSSAVAGNGPIMAGGSFTATVTLDANHRYLSLANMVVPSNDTFAAFGPAGIVLLNQDGTPRTDAEIAADIADEFIAWDAGTERNQAGAAGPDQAPRQAGPNTGADEGNALVRLLGGQLRSPESTDSVWSYPNVSDVVRVTIMQPAPTALSLNRFETNNRSDANTIILGLLSLGFIAGSVIGIRRRQKKD